MAAPPPRHDGRRLPRLVVAASLWTLASISAASAQDTSEHWRLKAAFIFRFPQFVEWPASAVDGRPTVELCALEPGPLPRALEELASGEAIGGRALAVRVVRAGRGVDGCHVLFVNGPEAERRAALRQVATRPVLTVGDTAGFLGEGGIIRLILLKNRLRFEISTANATRAHLRLSAQLLQLAVAVHGGAP